MKATPQTFLRFIAGAAVAAAVLFLVWYFSSIVVYILVSAVLAVMGNPLVKFLSGLHFKGWQVPRWRTSASEPLLGALVGEGPCREPAFQRFPRGMDRFAP